MTLETVVSDLTAAVSVLTASVQDKRDVLDNAAAQGAGSLATAQSHLTTAKTKVTEATASATAAANALAQVTAYKTAATALNTATTATQAVTNLLPDMLAKKDPARHPFRNKQPTLVLDFERQRCHRYSPETGYGETPLNTFMTFTRGSTATYTGPDGLIKTAAINTPRYDYDPVTGECKGILIEEQRTNTSAYSSVVRPASYLLTGTVLLLPGIVTPMGDINAIELKELGTSTGHYTFKVSSSSLGVTTFSVFAKAKTRTKIFLFVNSRLQTAISFDLVTKATAKLNTDSVISWGITECANGWFRCWITFDSNSGSCGFGLLESNSVGYMGDGVSSAYFCGTQLEAGAFPTSYIPTPATFTGRASTATYLDSNGVVQTAAINVARSAAYDYDSDGVLRPVDLLLESSATNRLLYSEQFDNAAWAKTSEGTATAPVVTANYATAPDGTTTADRVVFALNGGLLTSDNSRLYQPVTTVVGTAYTQSVWLKTADGSTKSVLMSFNGEATKLLTVTGTWQRFSNTGTASDTDRGFRLALRGAAGTSDSADLLVWGAQQGEGAYPTSYIPTTSAQVTRAADGSTSAQVTRSADNASVIGSNFAGFYNQTQGTLAATGRVVALSQNKYPRIVSIGSGGSYANTASLYADSGAGKYGAIVWNAGVLQSQLNGASVVINTPCVLATRIGNNNMAYADVLGVLSDNTTTLPRIDRLYVGASTPSSDIWNGHISNITYYPQPFTNEELQTFTAP